MDKCTRVYACVGGRCYFCVCVVMLVEGCGERLFMIVCWYVCVRARIPICFLTACVYMYLSVCSCADLCEVSLGTFASITDYSLSIK